MDPLTMIIIFWLFSNALLAPRIQSQALRFLHNWDLQIEKPAKRLTPPRIIQWRFRIPNKDINIVTYIFFMEEFVIWILGILAIPLCIFLGYSDFIDWIVYPVVLLLLPTLLTEAVRKTICLSITRRKRNQATDETSSNTQAYFDLGISAPKYKNAKAVQDIFCKDFYDFTRVQTILSEKDLLQKIFKKQTSLLDEKNIMRYKKYFDANDFAFMLSFFDKISPLYIATEDDYLMFNFETNDDEDTAIFCGFQNDNDMEKFQECIGKGASITALKDGWYVVIFE